MMQQEQRWRLRGGCAAKISAYKTSAYKTSAPWRPVYATIAALALLLAAPAAGSAQQVIALVNGDPVTAYDVDQRVRLTQISTQRTPARQEVIQELIDEHLKIQLLRRYAIDGMDKEVDAAFAAMAGRMRLTAQQFTDELSKSGVSPRSLKSKIKADITWSQVIRAKYHSSLQITEKDILAKIEENKVEDKAAYDYTLRPILFLVPRGAPDSARVARLKEAEALRARFTDCESGVRIARGLRDVAVRAPVTRNSADLSPALREILEKTEIGRLSAPEPTGQGIEIYALCGKKQYDADNTLGKRKAREELFASQFETHSKRFIRELRSQAMIEYR